MPKDKIHHKTYLLLGSNQGDRERNLSGARHLLGQQAGTLRSVSSVYMTQPWHMESDTWFLNQVVELTTSLAAEELLHTTLGIEAQLGRHRDKAGAGGYQPRTMDIDMLYYDDLVLNTKQLILPHPRIEARRFTLMPLCEIAPDHLHPVSLKTQRELLAACEDNSVVIKLD